MTPKLDDTRDSKTPKDLIYDMEVVLQLTSWLFIDMI